MKQKLKIFWKLSYKTATKNHKPFPSKSSLLRPVKEGIDYIWSQEKVILISILYLICPFPIMGATTSKVRSRNGFWEEDLSQAEEESWAFPLFLNDLKSAKCQSFVISGHFQPKLSRNYQENITAWVYKFWIMGDAFIIFMWLFESSVPFSFLSLIFKPPSQYCLPCAVQSQAWIEAAVVCFNSDHVMSVPKKLWVRMLTVSLLA